MKKEDKNLLVAGGLAGLFGSLCCLGPIAIVAFGLGGLSTALTLGKYTWLFSGLAGLFFIGAVVQYQRKKKKACCDVEPKMNWKFIIISFVLMAGLLLTLKYVVAPWLAGIVYL